MLLVKPSTLSTSEPCHLSSVSGHTVQYAHNVIRRWNYVVCKRRESISQINGSYIAMKSLMNSHRNNSPSDENTWWEEAGFNTTTAITQRWLNVCLNKGQQTCVRIGAVFRSCFRRAEDILSHCETRPQSRRCWSTPESLWPRFARLDRKIGLRAISTWLSEALSVNHPRRMSFCCWFT